MPCDAFKCGTSNALEDGVVQPAALATATEAPITAADPSFWLTGFSTAQGSSTRPSVCRTCVAGLTQCGGAGCVDVTSNPGNFGACGNNCPDLMPNYEGATCSNFRRGGGGGGGGGGRCVARSVQICCSDTCSQVPSFLNHAPHKALLLEVIDLHN